MEKTIIDTVLDTVFNSGFGYSLLYYRTKLSREATEDFIFFGSCRTLADFGDFSGGNSVPKLQTFGRLLRIFRVATQRPSCKLLECIRQCIFLIVACWAWYRSVGLAVL